jgi:hypothetical protein
MRNSIAFYGRVGGGKNLREEAHTPSTIMQKSLGGRFLTTPRFPDVTA